MSETIGTVQDDPEQVPPLDEREFLKKLKRRSLARTVTASFAVGVVMLLVLAGGYVAWQRGLQTQASRIFSYYPWLAEMTQPNVHVIHWGPTTSRSLGATDRYLVARMLGTRPVPADDVSIAYDVWGGETVSQAQGEITASAARRYEGSGLVPTLTFLHPAILARHERGQIPDIDVDMVPGYEFETARALGRLAALPASATVEVSLSFGELMAHDEAVRFVGDEGLLSWAAIDLWGDDGPPEDPNDYHRLGFPYGLFATTDADGTDRMDAEGLNPAEWMIEQLGQVEAFAPRGTSVRAGASADYIGRNGIRYYGAVVVGPAARMRELAQRDEVIAVGTGLVLLPGE